MSGTYNPRIQDWSVFISIISNCGVKRCAQRTTINERFLIRRLPGAAELQPKRLIHRFRGFSQIFYAAYLRRRGQIDHFYIVVVNLSNLSNLWIASRRDFDPSRRARDKLRSPSKQRKDFMDELFINFPRTRRLGAL